MEIRDEFDVSVLKRAEDILGTDYEMNIRDNDFNGYIDRENVIDMIENLCSEIENLREQIDNVKELHEEEIRDFYNPKSSYEIYGIRDSDFH